MHRACYKLLGILAVICRVHDANKSITCTINPHSNLHCNNGLVAVETFFINVTVKLARPVRRLSDYISLELIQQPDNVSTQYPVIFFEPMCTGVFDYQKTLYGVEVDQNVYNISKIVRVSDILKSAKVRGLLAGKDGDIYCEELVIPEQFTVPPKKNQYSR